MKHLFDIGRAEEVLCTTDEPFARLSFRVTSEDGITYDIYGKSRLVKDKGWLLLSIVNRDVARCFGEKATQFVCAYKPLLAFCARHLKDGDIDKFCKFNEKVSLPSWFKSEGILSDCEVPPAPVGVEEGEPFKVNLDDPRLKFYKRLKDFSAPLCSDMEKGK